MLETPKQRYFKKVYDNAPIILCACGCGTEMKNRDLYARPRKYVSGHNTHRKYLEPSQAKREWNHRNRTSRYANKKAHWRRKKVQLIRLKGGECFECGFAYNGKNACVFHLHHRDSLTKLFNIGNQVTNKAWKTILIEADKCDLICANCHEKKHSAEF